jgi:hypothetical protein
VIPGNDAMKPSSTCFLFASKTQLAISVLNYTKPAILKTILDTVRRGDAGSCNRVETPEGRETVYDCTSTAAKAPDFSGAPEIAARVFSRRSAVVASWRGLHGAPLPMNTQSKLRLLRSLALAAERYSVP